MAWTTPKTDWETGELVAASDMNAIGENLAALNNRASASYTTPADISADTNGVFQDVDGTNLNLEITTIGGEVLVHFFGVVVRTGNRDTNNFFDIEVDGNRLGDATVSIKVMSARLVASGILLG